MLQKTQDLSHRGFTLIELIITLVVGSLLGVMLYGIILSSGKHATYGLTTYKGYESLGIAMETLNAYYRSLLEQEDLINIFDEFSDDKIRDMVSQIDDAIVVTTKYVLFDENGHEMEDNTEKRILKVVLTKNNFSIANLFSR